MTRTSGGSLVSCQPGHSSRASPAQARCWYATGLYAAGQGPRSYFSLQIALSAHDPAGGRRPRRPAHFDRHQPEL